jgi:hypothetical protein
VMSCWPTPLPAPNASVTKAIFHDNESAEADSQRYGPALLPASCKRHSPNEI